MTRMECLDCSAHWDKERDPVQADVLEATGIRLPKCWLCGSHRVAQFLGHPISFSNTVLLIRGSDE